MFDQLRALFLNPAAHETPLPEADAHHALGALMVRAAKADNTYLFEEIAFVDRVLAERHGLDPVAAAQMRAACERLEAEMPRTEDLTAILHNAIGAEEMETTLRALWGVVFADGHEHRDEARMLHQIEAFLGIPADRAKALQAEASA
jgi:uncharacterized tellurite resistance protein B-like protein